MYKRQSQVLLTPAPTSSPGGGGGSGTLLLGPCAPVPFSSGVTIPWSIPEAATDADMQLSVTDMTGRTVRTLFAGPAPGSRGALVWDGSDGEGSPLPSGIYFCVLRAGDATATERLLLLR